MKIQTIINYDDNFGKISEHYYQVTGTIEVRRGYYKSGGFEIDLSKGGIKPIRRMTITIAKGHYFLYNYPQDLRKGKIKMYAPSTLGAMEIADSTLVKEPFKVDFALIGEKMR